MSLSLALAVCVCECPRACMRVVCVCPCMSDCLFPRSCKRASKYCVFVYFRACADLSMYVCLRTCVYYVCMHTRVRMSMCVHPCIYIVFFHFYLYKVCFIYGYLRRCYRCYTFIQTTIITPN